MSPPAVAIAATHAGRRDRRSHSSPHAVSVQDPVLQQRILLALIAAVACTPQSDPQTDTGASSSGEGSTSADVMTSAPTSDAQDPDAACARIVEACHSKDDGSDPTIAECHATGHAGTTECIDEEAACVAYCEAAPPAGGDSTTGSESGGTSSTGHDVTTGTDGGSSGSTTDPGTSGGPSPACEGYCECMGETCTEIAGYPWSDIAGCLDACAGYDEPQMTCWSMWCTEAKKGALVVHLCEHAWGMYDLDECP